MTNVIFSEKKKKKKRNKRDACLITAPSEGEESKAKAEERGTYTIWLNSHDDPTKFSICSVSIDTSSNMRWQKFAMKASFSSFVMNAGVMMERFLRLLQRVQESDGSERRVNRSSAPCHRYFLSFPVMSWRNLGMAWKVR